MGKSSPKLSIAKRTKDQELIVYALAEKRLKDFVRAALIQLEPKTEFKWNWHHSLICEYLEAVELGQIQNLIINVPPRSLKSTIVTICYPVWTWLKRPEKKYLFGSYSDSLARKHSLIRRNLIESPWFTWKWNDRFRLADDQNVKSDYMNNKTGQMRSSGILGSITGEGADTIIWDDPHNPTRVESDKERQSILDAIDSSWSSRLNDKVKGSKICVMQRVHHQDATAHLKSQGDWEELVIRSAAEKYERYIFPVSGRIKEVQENELLQEKREPKEVLEKMLRSLGSYRYAAQYQQRPSPKAGGIVPRTALRFYTRLPDRFDEKIIVADLTFKASENSDYTVIQAWGRLGPDYYLIDQIRERMGFLNQISALQTMQTRHPDAYEIVIEAKANGDAVIETLKQKISGITPFNPMTSKESRLNAVSPSFESGNVWFPHESQCHWIGGLIDELMGFPVWPNDDQVDCISMAILKLRTSAVSWLDQILKK